jgi:ABC-2 type transport system ATP-binding protein
VATLLAAARRIEETQIEVTDLGLRRPSLDEVFLTLTGAAQALPAAPDEVATTTPSNNGHYSERVA